MEKETIHRAYKLYQRGKDLKEVLKFLEKEGTRINIVNFTELEPSCLESITREKCDRFFLKLKDSLKGELEQIGNELDML